MPAKKKSAKEESLDFEATVAQLETLLKKMDETETSLEDSIRAFEKGTALIKSAQDYLEAAEQRVTQLLEEDGEPVEIPLDEDELDS